MRFIVNQGREEGDRLRWYDDHGYRVWGMPQGLRIFNADTGEEITQVVAADLTTGDYRRYKTDDRGRIIPDPLMRTHIVEWGKARLRCEPPVPDAAGRCGLPSQPEPDVLVPSRGE